MAEIVGIRSPCVGVCKINANIPLCEGCFRTRLEILKWPAMEIKDKQIVLSNITQRRQLYSQG